MLDDRKNHAKLASYLIKESRSTMRRCREQGIRRRRYTCSAGMAKPEIRYQCQGRDVAKRAEGQTGYASISLWRWV